MPITSTAPSSSRPSPWSHRAPIAVALTLAACILWPTVAHWHRSRVAARLAERAGAGTAAAARGAIGELALLGLPATEALVRLAASQRPDVALAAQDAVLDQLAAWEVEFDSRCDSAALAENLHTLGAALCREVAQLDGNGRRWARRVARQVVELTGALDAQQSWPVLRDCELVLASPIEPPPRRADPVATAAAAAPVVPDHSATPPATSPREVQSPAMAADDDGAVAELAVVMPGAANIAPVVAAPLPAEDGANILRPPPVQPPPPASADGPVAETPQPPLAPHAAEPVVEVPSPLELRQIARRMRTMSDRQLAQVAQDGPRYESAAARRVLEQRGYTAAMQRAMLRVQSEPAANPRPRLDAVAALPPAEARQLLRRLVADEDPEIRLQALATLATTGDPHLEELARQRAVEDDDPRVADLATRLIKPLR